MSRQKYRHNQSDQTNKQDKNKQTDIQIGRQQDKQTADKANKRKANRKTNEKMVSQTNK